VDLSRFRLATQPLSRSGPLQQSSTIPRRVFSGLKITEREQGDVRVALSKRAEQEARVESIEVKQSQNRPRSGVQQLIDEVQSRTQRIKALQSVRDDVAEGSERSKGITDEIAAEESALRSIFESSTYQRLREVLSNVQQAFAAGTDGASLSRGLSSEASFLGGGFLSKVGFGDSFSASSLALSFDSIVAAVQSGERGSSFFSTIDNAVQGARKAISGGLFDGSPDVSEASAVTTLVAPAPTIKQVSFAGADELAIGLRGYIGADAVHAALAHIEYDPAQAIVLLAAEPEDEDEKKEKAERENEERSERLSAGLRSDGE
jgi:hypothetical protein